jgi:murein DD-endopeptidase MepM/ murein hydrolase activator NlpD
MFLARGGRGEVRAPASTFDANRDPGQPRLALGRNRRARARRPGLTRLAGVAGAIALVTVLGTACGQFPQARRSAQLQAQRVAAEAAPSPSEAAAPPRTGGMPDSGPLSGDDGKQGPRGATITGGKSRIDLSRHFRAARTARKGSGGSKTGTTPSGSKGSTTGSRSGSKGSTTGSRSGSKGGSSAGSTTKRSSKGDDGAHPGTPDITGRITSGAGSADANLATLISRMTQRGARYNSTVLPAGFPFQICPVQGRYSYSDDYGAPRYAGGYHPHAGNDIFAAEGTPIVAPFDGFVQRVPNTLGGNAVEVHGAQGYVYMAHLVAYGITDRQVPAGTVVGFVGNSGDAQGTSYHDHFEWHPSNVQPYDRSIAGTNGAVDPFPYLQVVCPPT